LTDLIAGKIASDLHGKRRGGDSTFPAAIRVQFELGEHAPRRFEASFEEEGASERQGGIKASGGEKAGALG